MLGRFTPTATVAVKDLAKAKAFYAGILGLKEVHNEGDEFISYEAGESTIGVYSSEFAGTNKATSVTWDLGNEVRATVKGLVAKGVRFEHYDLPGLTRDGDVHTGGGMAIAWFKDPDGNIHALAGTE